MLNLNNSNMFTLKCINQVHLFMRSTLNIYLCAFDMKAQIIMGFCPIVVKLYRMLT